MTEPLYIAVDLGAGSGRVFLAGVEPGEFLLEEVRRFHYPASRSEGHLRWDATRIFEEIQSGARDAADRARELGRPIRSIGVDSWGVDYGFVDEQGDLLQQPVCYRDDRTEGIMEEVFAQVSRQEIFNRTGIQFLVFNTLFQLYANVKEGIPKSAAKMLLIPDLINLFLTGRSFTEYTNATTTQMVNAATGSWDRNLVSLLGVPERLLADIVPSGADIGPIEPALAQRIKLEGVRVIAPATHDTGSAVAGAPLEDGWAYISSGTWSLVGVERERPLISEEVARHNFTNEGGAFGTTRFLKNVMGLWILESCRKEWKASGPNENYDENYDRDYDALLGRAAAIEQSPGLIFPDDPRFLNPPSMLAAIARQLEENGGLMPDEPAAVARVILDSLALRYASVLRAIESLTRERIKGVRVVGGGSRNQYLNQATATVTGLPVIAGPVEATAVGNVLIQATSGARFATLSQGRQHVAHNVPQQIYAPQRSDAWESAARMYRAIELRYEPAPF